MSSRIVDTRSPSSIRAGQWHLMLSSFRWCLRGIVFLNLALLVISDNSKEFYRLLEKAQLNRSLAFWFMASTFLLPLAVLLEALFCRKTLRREWKPILLDAALVTMWFVVLWGSAVYSLFHTVWL